MAGFFRNSTLNLCREWNLLPELATISFAYHSARTSHFAFWFLKCYGIYQVALQVDTNIFEEYGFHLQAIIV
jgi:membrane-anchored protein YejM (alkaline phosphatase superfamily)